MIRLPISNLFRFVNKDKRLHIDKSRRLQLVSLFHKSKYWTKNIAITKTRNEGTERRKERKEKGTNLQEQRAVCRARIRSFLVNSMRNKNDESDKSRLVIAS